LSSYGLAGTSPFVTWQKPASHILADFLASYWNSTETGATLNTINYPASEVGWNHWFNNDKDLTIKFYDSVTIVKDEGCTMLGGAVQEEDRIIQIHIFARSWEDDADSSAETMCFNVEEHFKKVIHQHGPELINAGILKLFVRNSQDRPYVEKEESFNAVTRRRVMTIVMRVWRVNQ
jgi:hypothetical protein